MEIINGSDVETIISNWWKENEPSAEVTPELKWIFKRFVNVVKRSNPIQVIKSNFESRIGIIVLHPSQTCSFLIEKDSRE